MLANLSWIEFLFIALLSNERIGLADLGPGLVCKTGIKFFKAREVSLRLTLDTTRLEHLTREPRQFARLLDQINS